MGARRVLALEPDILDAVDDVTSRGRLEIAADPPVVAALGVPQIVGDRRVTIRIRDTENVAQPPPTIRQYLLIVDHRDRGGVGCDVEGCPVAPGPPVPGPHLKRLRAWSAVRPECDPLQVLILDLIAFGGIDDEIIDIPGIAAIHITQLEPGGHRVIGIRDRHHVAQHRLGTGYELLIADGHCRQGVAHKIE